MRHGVEAHGRRLLRVLFLWNRALSPCSGGGRQENHGRSGLRVASMGECCQRLKGFKQQVRRERWAASSGRQKNKPRAHLIAISGRAPADP